MLSYMYMTIIAGIRNPVTHTLFNHVSAVLNYLLQCISDFSECSRVMILYNTILNEIFFTKILTKMCKYSRKTEVVIRRSEKLINPV